MISFSNEDFAIKYDDFNIIVEHKYFYTIDEATLDYITDKKVLIHTLNLSTIQMKKQDAVVVRVLQYDKF